MHRFFSPSQKPAAYIPFYKDGNCVKVIMDNGEVSIIEKGIRSVLKNIMEESHLDIGSIRNNFAKYTGRKIILPVPVDVENILIPVKIRKPLSTNDGSFAYFNILSVKEVQGDRNAAITLSCNMTVETLESKKLILRKMDLGYLMRDRLEIDIFGEDSVKSAFCEIAVEYSKPATKGDIAVIARELLYIRNRLER